MEICFAMFYIFPFQKLHRLYDEKSYDIVGHDSIKEYKLLVVGVSYRDKIRDRRFKSISLSILVQSNFGFRNCIFMSYIVRTVTYWLSTMLSERYTSLHINHKICVRKSHHSWI
jgi:hypothetical protein